MPDLEGSAELYLEFETTHLRFPLDEVFVNDGGSIAAAGARGSTLMMLTGNDYSVKHHLTETPSTVRIQVPRNDWDWEGESGVVTMSNRMHMIVCSELNSTPAVNVVLGDSVSGEMAVRVATLFDRKVNGELISASGAAVSRYGSWMNSDNTYGFRHVRFVSGDGDEFPPHFKDDPEKNKRIDRVAGRTGLMQAKYDQSWKVRDAVVLPELTNLTKFASESSYGLGASGFVPSFAVADQHFPHSINALEDFLKATLSTELGNEENIKAFCTTAHGRDAAKYAGSVVTAISLITNTMMPYRSDGALVLMAGNKTMFKQSEKWDPGSNHSPHKEDDCEGSACKSIGIDSAIRYHAEVGSPAAYPFVTASAKALAHYTPAIGIVAANAGHADNANSTSANNAGHAVCCFIKNTELVRAMHETSTSSMSIDGTYTNVSSSGSDKEKATKLTDVRLRSVFPRKLLATLPADEVACIEAGWDSVNNSKMFESMPNFLVAEGTTPCASRVYTHDAAERQERATASEASNKVLKRFAPNVMRSYRWLDSSRTGRHLFYNAFAELAFQPNIGLYTDPDLRASGDATAHVVLTKQPVEGMVKRAGATPKELETSAFGAIPLFTMGKEEGTLFDEAMDENKRNTMRSPPGVYQMNEFQSANMSISLNAFERLRNSLSQEFTRSDLVEANWIASIAALANNPKGVAVFVDDILSLDGVAGSVDIHPIRGIAKHATTGEDIGAFVSVSLMVPPQ